MYNTASFAFPMSTLVSSCIEVFVFPNLMNCSAEYQSSVRIVERENIWDILGRLCFYLFEVLSYYI